MKPLKMNKNDYKSISEYQQKIIDKIISEGLIIAVTNGNRFITNIITKEGKKLQIVPRNTSRAMFQSGIFSEIETDKSKGDFKTYGISKEYFRFSKSYK